MKTRKRAALIVLAMALILVPGAGRAPAAGANSSPQRKLIAYYFHITQRCATCLAIERQAKQAIQSAFPEELKAKRVEWRPVNVEMDQNQHFIRDYRLVTSSLVLVQTEDGKPKTWKNMDKVWTLVKKKDAFSAYVQDGVRKLLEN